MAHLLQCVRLMPALEAGLAQRHQVCRLFEQPDPATFLRQEGGGFTGRQRVPDHYRLGPDGYSLQEYVAYVQDAFGFNPRYGRSHR